MTTPMTKEALAGLTMSQLAERNAEYVSEITAKDKRIAEQSMLLEGSDAILADYAETLDCAGDTDSIMAAIVALQSRVESAEQALLLEKQKRAEDGISVPPAPAPVPDEIRLLQSEVTIWKDRWEFFREFFREVADKLGCDVKDHEAILDKIEMLQGKAEVSDGN